MTHLVAERCRKEQSLLWSGASKRCSVRPGRAGARGARSRSAVARVEGAASDLAERREAAAAADLGGAKAGWSSANVQGLTGCGYPSAKIQRPYFSPIFFTTESC